MWSRLILLSLVTAVLAVPYSEYILTPTSRTLRPVSVYAVNGTVENAEDLTNSSSGATIFSGPSSVTYDFGKDVAGIVSFDVSSVSETGELQFIGISFTESSLWVAENCDATADAGIDTALWWNVEEDTNYTAATQFQRGGFRYLSVIHNTTGDVILTGLTIHYTAIPHISDTELANGIYTGYFHCEDDQINRVWYAGAYTNEMCTISPTAGDSLVHLGVINSSSVVTEPLSWYNNYTISNGSSVLTDGAKRDRLVWPGDIAISQPSTFVSTYDMITMRNSLDSLLALQNASGALPYLGRHDGALLNVFSFTYHLYSLIDLYDYHLYTGNTTYLKANWNAFKLGLNFSLSFIDDSNLAYVTTSADWLRFGMGGHNIEANSILYYTINLGIALASELNDTSELVASWPSINEKLKSAANERLWDATANLYRDNDTAPLTDLHPQDGNSWAVLSNLTSSLERAVNVSEALEKRWGKYGAPAPEAGATVSPFISGFELQAHYLAGRPESAIKLVKLMWGDFMLDDPRMTNSTFIEGYSTNGDLHYAPYTNDPRISHAHGWATGPTSALTFYAAGLQVISKAGQTWRISPQLGGLQTAQAGYKTDLGEFSSNVTTSDKRNLEIVFMTPVNTSGTVRVPYSGGNAILTLMNNDDNDINTSVGNDTVVMTLSSEQSQAGFVTVNNVSGGNYTVTLVFSS